MSVVSDESKESTRPTATTQRERIAVLFVHGQGDQRPMDDLLELAFSTWESNEAASKGAQLGTIWNKPVEDRNKLVVDGNSMDQRCLSGKDSESVEVDYYQYYWAHLMSGNRFSHFWLWLTDLIAKKKEDVPQVFRPVRLGMIFAARFITIIAVIYAFGSALLLYWWGASWDVPTALNWPNIFAGFFLAFGAGILVARLSSANGRVRYEAEAAFLFSAMLFWALAYGLHHYPPWESFEKHASADDCPVAVAGILNSLNLWRVSFDLSHGEVKNCLAFANSAITVVVLIIACLAAIVGWIGARNFLVPVMADSARYFRVRPENINNRERIRANGVAYLKNLHLHSANYDRIIVIGHSLGSSVAFGMLDQYWGEISSKIRVKPCPTVSKFEKACLDLDRSTLVGVKNNQIARFRGIQRKLFQELRMWADELNKDKQEESEKVEIWRVSDFITLGSPLAYAPFLISETYLDYETHLRKHRRYASCPPQGDKLGGELRIVERANDSKADAPHFSLPHSGVFAVTRWTNFFFRTRGFFDGDIIGGPVAPIFGPGVLDIELDPSETNRRFAHNEYWKWPARDGDDVASRGQDRRAYDNPPKYLQALRLAMNLFNVKAEEKTLIKLRKEL